MKLIDPDNIENNDFLVVNQFTVAAERTHPSASGRGAGGEGREAKPALEVLVKGIFEKRRFLDYVMNFITFEDDGKTIAKKAAA